MTIQPENTGSEEYRSGDRVKMKRGDGPTMVVTEVYPQIYAYRYRCNWQGEDGGEQSEVFRSDDLVPAD